MERGRGGRYRIIDSLSVAKALFAPVFDRARNERLCIAHLDPGQRLIGFRVRYAGDDGQVTFPMREIIADAMSLGTRALILAHNHPSGDPTPSATDIETTRGLAQAARPMGVRVHDHLVFAGGRCESFRARGLL